jgi:hypothetical protein
MGIYRGHCHCGALGFEYRTAVDPAGWSVRACQCSYCRAHGAVYTSDPVGSLRFTHRDPTQLSRYRFGHQTADFIFCGRCGGYLGAVTQTETDGRVLAVINIRAMDPRPAGLPEAQPISYDGETSDTRESRRSVRWTPVTDD